MMPKIVRVGRHAESEANEANRNLKRGEGHKNPTEIVGVPEHLCRLTYPRGVRQANAMGDWFRANGIKPDILLFSSYVRAMETALETDLMGEWMADDRFRERHWGRYGRIMAQEEYSSIAPHIRECLDSHWLEKPLDGESKAEARDRACIANDSLARNYADLDVFILSHGEFITALAATYFHWPLIDLPDPEGEWGPILNPVNCQIIEFSREDPFEPLQIHESFKWVRCIVPWDPFHEHNIDWRPIVRKKYDLATLRQLVERYPRYFPSTD